MTQFAVLAIMLGTASATPPSGASLRRYALLVGANDGGQGRPKLRYADSDAEAMERVLRELGGVLASDSVLLLDPDRATFRMALDRLRIQVAGGHLPGVATEVLVYYSGHSDFEGLLLKGEHLSYQELRHDLDGFRADVRIAILDSCASGELTRAKGGVARPAFLIDSANQVQGHAFLTSSSADEASQESDGLRASFFTHALLSGLRGGADATGDGRVTLNEAYQFAFQETLARTERTEGGAQHPAYDIQLAGSGDVIMTDLRGTSAVLRIARDLAGRLFVRDAADHLVVELAKTAGHPIELALEPGAYQVTLDRGGNLFEAHVVLSEGRRTDLDEPLFVAIPGASTVRRGTLPPRQYRQVPINVSLWPGFADSNGPGDTLDHLSLAVFSRTSRLEGFSLSLAGSWVNEDAVGLRLAEGFNFEAGRLVGGDLALITNIAKGEVLGAQVAGILNLAGHVKGLQVAEGLNWITGDLEGLQLAGLANIDRGTVRGIQIGELNWSHTFIGSQIGVAANIGTGVGRGVQVSGFNWTGNLEGLQLGIANVATEDLRGVQLAEGLNWSTGTLAGLQLGGWGNVALGKASGLQLGLVNVGGDVQGAQVGLVNIAHDVTGAQVGLVNVSNAVDAPLGIVNAVLQGQFHPEVWAGDASPLNVGLKLGSRRVYSLLSFGYDPLSSQPFFIGAAAIGVHFPLRRFWLDADLGLGFERIVSAPTGPANLLPKVRATFGYQFAPHLSVFLGLALDCLVQPPESRSPNVGYGLEYDASSALTQVHVWPGPYLGVQF
ncbi:MAG: caspase family protein [Myxococcales bacterium]